jgi:tripartite-type tricarboxylate transporter receptor subunit TctC
MTTPPPVMSAIRDGKLRALALASPRRHPSLPDVPTTAEAGYPAIVGDNWQGLVVPAGTPKEAIAYVHRELVEIMKLPEVGERLGVLGFEPVAGTPEEFAQHAKLEFDKWAKVIKDSGIKTE